MKKMVSFLLVAAMTLTSGTQVLASAIEPPVLTEKIQTEILSESDNNEEAQSQNEPELQSSAGSGGETEVQSETESLNVSEDTNAKAESDSVSDVPETEGLKVTESLELESQTDEETAEEADKPEAPQNPAEIEVIMTPVTDLMNSVEFKAELIQGGNVWASKIITLGKDEQKVLFQTVPNGAYTLRVTAPGFAAYEQMLQIDGQKYSVNLLTGEMFGYEYQENSVHPGLIVLGDVTGDGQIADDDREKLVDAIDQEDNRPVNADSFDLNKDGEINLVDLEYFAQNYKKDRHTQATVLKQLSSAVITAQAVEGTKISGNMTELLEGNASVLASPENNAPISKENPVEIVFDVAENASAQVDGIVIETRKDNAVTSAVLEISYVDENGAEQIESIEVQNGIQYLLKNSAIKPTINENGTIEIHLGTQIAVKKVTLKITGTKKNNNLAEISKVEFVNGMEDRIPEVKSDIPKNLTAQTGSKEFTLTWDACTNITGYEVMISSGGVEEIYKTKAPMFFVDTFQGKELVNQTEYEVCVQSVNGMWKSGYSEKIKVVPKADKVPDAPDNVKAVGKYKSILVSWKKMKDTDSYRLFYKEADSGDSYTVVEGIKENTYTIPNLKDVTTYEVYVTGVNEIGESSPSLKSRAVTESIDAAQLPEYKLINTGEAGQRSDHITSVLRGRGEMKDSPLDTEEKTAWGLVDHNPASHFYISDWDEGAAYPNQLGEFGKGFSFEFDKSYTIDTIGFHETYDDGVVDAVVDYWDEAKGSFQRVDKLKVEERADNSGKRYCFIKLEEPVQTDKIRIGLGRRYSSVRTIAVSEIYFYHYDSLEDDIMALYEDASHTVLKKDVTEETINALNERVQTVDEVSGEYHPDKARFERELQNARDILNNELTSPVKIHNTITTNDVRRGFGGQNAWQPLGIVAAAGEEITIFVGHNTLPVGSKTNLQLIPTQYHAESTTLTGKAIDLYVGRNDITIPKISTTAAEAGGALYVQYTGKNTNDEYAVRVNGGVKVPVLDLYRVTDEAERLARVEKYVEELKVYTSAVPQQHEQLHAKSDNKNVNYPYDSKNCILEATDILMETMMLSVPAKQILDGCGGNTQTLLASMDAMEDMMHLFYQHKGLNRSAQEESDQLPKGHLNIRYQRMFAGAFMYAGGNHIGIEWPETQNLAKGVPVESENGKYKSGNYFGWGITHEIGHNINQDVYAVAEITNNYFAQLAQAKDSDEGMRFKYPNIYKKVTSGTAGQAADLATQLGMYWQLHLAYDNDYNYKTYDNYNEQLEKLFYARVDSYARNPKEAPSPGGIALNLSKDKNQDLMRLACAAAQKNNLEFFRRWGMTPNEETIAYAKQFDEETRAIYYVSDDSRVYRIENQNRGSSLNTEGTVEAVDDDVTAVVNPQNKSQVDINLSSKNIPSEDVLGYEIVRTTMSGGEIEREVAGFTTETVFNDHIMTMNNRVVTYEVTVVDKFLNRSAVKTLQPIKVEHDGSIDKDFWSVKTENLTAKSEIASPDANDNMPCAPSAVEPIMAAVDKDMQTTYLAELSGTQASVTMEFNKFHEVSGFKYTLNNTNDDFGAVEKYAVYTRTEDGVWKEAAAGSFDSTANVQTIYFGNEDGKYVSTYRTDAVKLVIFGQTGEKIAISELDVIGITGDNVDFRSTDEGIPAIGRLASDYKYGTGETDVIPKDSIIFTGTYKGNPAYNVVLLYDQNGEIVGGTDAEGNLKAHQIILADVKEDAEIQEVYDGTWIYWIEPQDQSEILDGKVRAELYRVNNAQTNEGQRLVSDSFFKDVPAELPDIELTGNSVAGKE